MSETCEWGDEWDGGYDTGCGGQWCVPSGTPASNGMEYCPFCGRPIEVQQPCTP